MVKISNLSSTLLNFNTYNTTLYFKLSSNNSTVIRLKMFLSTNSIHGIERMFAGVSSRYCFLFSCPFPYKWDKNKQVFSVNPKFQKWWIIPFSIWMIASALQVVLKFVKPDLSEFEKIYTTYLMLLYANMAIYFTRFHHIYADDVCYFLNQLIQFEKQQKILENGNG